jgi:RND family efflux transporter MFP subunit
MKKILAPVVVLFAGLTLAMLLIKAKPGAEPRTETPPPMPVVSVIYAQPASLRLPVISQGTVRPRMEIDLVTQVAGIVESVHPAFAEGAYVNKDDILLSIESADYEIALIRTKAKIAEAEQLLATERARSNQASKEWRDLNQADANDLFLRKPQLKSADASLAAAHADYRAAELNLERTRIRAPFNGRVRDKHVDIGQYLSPGTPLARLYASDTLEVRLPLNDRQVGLIDLPRRGASQRQPPAADVTLSASFGGQHQQWSGRLVRTEASIDVDSRMLYVIVEVESKPHNQAMPLSVGMFVNAEIAGKLMKQVITLPRQALQLGDQLLALDDQDRLHFETATVLQQDRLQVYVTSALAANSRIVTTNLPMAVNGMQVSVKPSDDPQMTNDQEP